MIAACDASRHILETKLQRRLIGSGNELIPLAGVTRSGDAQPSARLCRVRTRFQYRCCIIRFEMDEQVVIAGVDAGNAPSLWTERVQ